MFRHITQLKHIHSALAQIIYDKALTTRVILIRHVVLCILCTCHHMYMVLLDIRARVKSTKGFVEK